MSSLEVDDIDNIKQQIKDAEEEIKETEEEIKETKEEIKEMEEDLQKAMEGNNEQGMKYNRDRIFKLHDRILILQK